MVQGAAADKPADKPAANPRSPEFDPEQYRMTLGEHLDELRRRLVRGLVGLFVAVIGCMAMGERIIVVFCAPLVSALQERGINPQLYYTEIGGAFMTYLKISLISALFISAPWLVWQIWQFVAAGLYPRERKLITRFIPLSVSLLVAGMLFVYFAVLPMTVSIFIDFGSGVSIAGRGATTTQPASTQRAIIPQYEGDPADPKPFEWWFNKLDRQIKVCVDGEIRTLPYGPKNLLAPLITLPDYIDLVVLTMIVFGLAFQLPLVIMAIGRIGIVDVEGFKRSRRIVYFILAIAAAVIAPGDVVTTMLMLLVPLILLYELGIVLVQWKKPNETEGVRQ